MSGTELVGQARVIATVRSLVDAWRGFELGDASAPYPDELPRYEPADPNESSVSETTLYLLHHWFRHEPHALGRDGALFKYWPHQRRLVETFIYLFEVRGIRRTEELYALAGVDPLEPQRDPWAKLGGHLATGSGKTKMMSLLIAWAYLNSVCEPDSRLGFGRHSLLIAPGLFVRDRLLADFSPPHGGTSVFFGDPVVPSRFEPVWDLKVYSPATCPMKLDPAEGALVVTNYHQLLKTADEQAPAFTTWEARQMQMLFEGKEPERLESVSSPLLDRFSKSRGLLVLNDEAHHVGDEPAHAQFEQRQRERAKLGEDAAADMAWIRSLRKLHGDAAKLGGGGRLALQVDLSATLFAETGSTQRAAPTARKSPRAEFKPNELFRHTAVHYGLAEAIRDRVVKRPILERVEVRNKKTGAIDSGIREGQPNAWEKYRNLLVTGIERWKKVRDQLQGEGSPAKPILFILCDNRNEAREVTNYLTHGDPSREELATTPIGWKDPSGGPNLFLDVGPDGVTRSTVIEIHIGKKEEENETEWERVRQAVNAIDRDQIPDPSGALDAGGRPVMVHNPYNVVVSVMMLKEGWDVRNVKVIVPLRPCESRTLTEQILGRGLRKMHQPRLADDGAAELLSEQLFVIEHPSFDAIMGQIADLVDRKDSDEIEHAREYVPVQLKANLVEREERGVRLVRFEGMREVVPDWRKHFDVNRVAALVPRLAWAEELADTEIQTYLREAMQEREQQGQTFTLPENPSYRDFDHVIEAAYAVPLLRDLRTSYQHKTAVKGVVQDYLERKTFSLPAGLPLAFDRVIEAGNGKIALGNLARSEVIRGVRHALLPDLRKAITSERAASQAMLSERGPSDLGGYQALKKNVLPTPPQRSAFDAAAFDSADELRLAMLLDRASDVTGWLYNHRSGVGYSIEYDWQGYTARYFPDFVVRAKLGPLFHNFIVEVKGRIDDRDKEKAKRGQRYCELLNEHDREPWHYLFLVENEGVGRTDITWWHERSRLEMADLLRRHEALPLIPQGVTESHEIIVLASVTADQEFVDAVPVHDLAAAAGDFGESHAPTVVGWAKLGRAARTLDRSMFVARVTGKSMEPHVSDGSWCLFRSYSAGAGPSSTAIDNHRVVVELRDATDPEHGGRYTLKRWRVTSVGADGSIEEISLVPDNTAYPTLRLRPEDGDLRVIAQLIEVLS